MDKGHQPPSSTKWGELYGTPCVRQTKPPTFVCRTNFVSWNVYHLSLFLRYPYFFSSIWTEIILKYLWCRVILFGEIWDVLLCLDDVLGWFQRPLSIWHWLTQSIIMYLTTFNARACPYSVFVSTTHYIEFSPPPWRLNSIWFWAQHEINYGMWTLSPGTMIASCPLSLFLLM